MEEIQLTSGPHRLAATLVRGVTAADAGAPAILFVHGLRSDRSGYVARARRAAEELGATCLALDLTGHGSSTGEVTEVSPNEHVEDLVRRGLVEDPAAAVLLEPELQALELDAEPVGHVHDPDRAEVRMSRTRAHGRELRLHDLDLVVAPRRGVVEGLEVRHGGHRNRWSRTALSPSFARSPGF